MGISHFYRKQHNQLLELAKEISTLIGKDQLEQDAILVRALLSKLIGRLKVHLAVEDNALYPELLKHDDPEIVSTARRFMEEMGGINETLKAYADRWSTADCIKAAPQEFIGETSELLEVLAWRIEEENNNLFPLVDKT